MENPLIKQTFETWGLAFGCLAVAIASPALGVEPHGKEKFSLLNPTPRELWREVSPDRPDTTESPITVDAGAVQLEMSFIDYTRNGDVTVISAPPFGLKLGVTNSIDVQLFWDAWVDQDIEGVGSEDAFGDMVLRAKFNLWGNDPGPGDDTAFAFMPFVKAPTATEDLGNGEVEGGFIFPFLYRMEGASLGLMFETDIVYDDIDDGYQAEFIHTAVLGFDLTDRLGVYGEYIGNASTNGDDDYRAQVGTGATFKLRPDIILDAGANFGIIGDADDLNLFTGITVRF